MTVKQAYLQKDIWCFECKMLKKKTHYQGFIQSQLNESARVGEAISNLLSAIYSI